MKQYLVYARAPFLSASIIPVLLGAAIAYHFEHVFKPLDFALTLFGMIFAHLGVNLANDYYDYLQGADQHNQYRHPFNGGSPHLVEGREKPELIRTLTWLSFALAAFCGLLLMWRVDGGIGPVFWLAIAGFVGGFFYTAPPLKFVYRGLGELFILFNFGVLPVLGAYYVQTGRMALSPILGGAVVGLLTTNILYINQFPDYQSDRDAGKATLVVRLGTARARYLYLLFLFCAAVLIVLASVWFSYPRFYLIGLLALAPAIAASRILMRYHNDPPNLRKGQALTILAQLITGAALTIGVMI